MGKRITPDVVVAKSLEFFQKHSTFNKRAVRKHDRNLYDHILNHFGQFSDVVSKDKSLVDVGSRVWSYNNICLSYVRDAIPPKVVKKIEKDYGGKRKLSSQVRQTFKFGGDLTTHLNDEMDVFNFLSEFLNTDLEMVSSPNGILCTTPDNRFDANFYIVDEKYKKPSLHKSNYAYEKYRKELDVLVKKSKVPVVIDMGKKITPLEVMKFLTYGGINFCDEFNILGIDPPTSRNLGFCIMNYSAGSFKVLESGTYAIPRYFLREGTIKDIHDFVSEIVVDYGCKAIVSESAFGYGIKKIRTQLDENVGVFRLIGELYNIPLVTISPLHFKSDVLGDHKATKEKTIEWVSKAIQKDKSKIEEHEADAVALALCYLIDRDLINFPEQ